jgi:hypothetical protein
MPLALLTQLPALISAGKDLFTFIGKVRETARQSGEWTPELEAQFQTLLDQAKTADHWQPSR